MLSNILRWYMKMHHLQNEFYELIRSDRRRVGLFITKKQIQAMNGQIEVESKPDVGTSFHVQLLI